MTDGGGSKTEESRGKRWFRHGRWVAALVLLVTAFWLFSSGTLRECSDVTTKSQTTQAGATTDVNGTVTSCGPSPAGSGAGLVALLLVAALFWPDLSEITVLGVTLKRRVAEANKKSEEAAAVAEDVKASISVLQARIDNLNFAVASNTNNISVHVDRGEYFTTSDSRRLADETDRDAPGRSPLDTASYSEYELIGRVITFWASLTQALNLDGRLEVAPDGLSPSDLARAERRRKFVDENRNRLRLLRRLRNAAAHHNPVDEEDLARGAWLLESLLGEVNSKVNRPVDLGDDGF
ncbi:hypothetical protein [Microbacterium sp. SLBN-111]|uniref:hypothetical protein n=1 Tax=Microbacterium sp. SLBN-111 TaxID=3377733 RepID=UPI003C766490